MNKLKFLRKQFGHLPKQGTQEWLDSRRTKIGGSEIASALGRCPYRKPGELIETKRNPQLLKSAACTFGRVFEIVTQQIIKDQWGHKLHHLGAIPATRWPLCYSPDGVIVEGDDLVLAEIKCPFRRSKIQQVPEHYLCQVQCGMNILPCNTCNFYQFRFRLCTLQQLGNTVKYNRYLHTESYKRCPETKPLRWGFVHFDADTDLVDLGKLSREHQEKMCCVDNLKATVYYETKDVPHFGYIMPWKLFDLSLVKIKRDDAFLDNCSSTLWEVHDKLLVKD